MRDETYYYASGTSLQKQKRQFQYAAMDLVEEVIENGYFIEGVYDLPSFVMVMRVLQQKKLLPKEIATTWKEELFADRQKVRRWEEAGEVLSYHFRLSDEFVSSAHYGHWLQQVLPVFPLENIYGKPIEAQEARLPYLYMGRSGRAVLFEYFQRETGVSFSDISLTEQKVYAFLSDVACFDVSPYLPEHTSFDMGIWGFPGIGTKHSNRALWKHGRMENFQNLLNTTRTALSYMTIDGQDGADRREVSCTEAVLEALAAYYMSWGYLHFSEIWKEAYRKASRKEVTMMQYPAAERTTINYEKDYVTSFPVALDTDIFLSCVEKISIKEGMLAIEDYGRLVLQGTYLDFWQWLYEDVPYQKDNVLAQIACYAENDRVREDKQKILEAFRYDAYAASRFVVPISFHSAQPEISYSQRRRVVAQTVEKERKAYFKELQKYSHSFTKFSIETESAAVFRKSTEKECQRYLREIDNITLCTAFVLYYPSQRDRIIEFLSGRLRIMILEDMKGFVKSEDFSLSACVESEQKIMKIIRKVQEKVGQSLS